jgi:hypothetical protein
MMETAPTYMLKAISRSVWWALGGGSVVHDPNLREFPIRECVSKDGRTVCKGHAG